LEQTQCRHSRLITSRFRKFETEPNVTLTSQMIKLGGTDFAKNSSQSRAIRKIAVMKKQNFIVNFLVAPQMLDALAKQVTRAPDNAMNGVAFLQKHFGQIRAVLAGDAGDQCSLVAIHRIELIMKARVQEVETLSC